MSTKTQQRATGAWRTIMRVVAVLFLLLAAADLAFPEICRENKTSLSTSSAEMAVAAAHTDGDASNQTSREDCFCCCSHIVSAEPQTLLSPIPETSGTIAGHIPASPSVPTLSFFRPPRVA